MAFSRLFGKSKRDVVSPTEHLERDDEAVLPAAAEPNPGQDHQLPYQLPLQTPQKTVLSRQKSDTHPLQGVHFTLSPR